MSDALMVSVSGVRGIVGSSLTPHVIVQYVESFAALYPGSKVVVGRDSRVSGPWILQLVCGVLSACGKEVVDIGIVPTPTVQLAVKLLHCTGGGLVVTSSHNPIEWNGLKFIAPDSLFLSPDHCKTLYALASPPSYAPRQGGLLSQDLSWTHRHVSTLLACPSLAPVISKIRARKLRVALDTVCGAGGPVMAHLLKELGCEVPVHLYPETSGVFPRPPEPIPAQLGELSKAVVEHKCDIGIAVDPDVDRCVLLDENGLCVTEEYTLACAVSYMCKTLGKKGLVVRNLSSSRVSDDIAKANGSTVLATPVGEVHVARAMLAQEAVIGGEGNGGVLLPEFHLGRDAPAACALVLAFLVSSDEPTMSKAIQALPQYHIVKLKHAMPPHFAKCVEAIKEEAEKQGHTINTKDGVRIDSPEGWVHLRASNTEPVFRVIGEYGSTAQSSTDYCNKILNQVLELSKTFE